MSHYTLLSGKDTSTYTFLCDGCKTRKDSSLALTLTTQHCWNATVCSQACAILANQYFNKALIDGRNNPVIIDLITIASEGQFTFSQLLNYVRGY